MGEDEVPHLQIDDIAPPAAAEDAVVARALDLEVAAVLLGDGRAQAVGGFRLTRAGDVVQLAFDGQQGGAADVLRAHALGLAPGRAHVPGSVDEAVVLEDRLDGLEVVIRVHVEHGVVLVVELAVGLGARIVALDQVLEVVVVALGVAVRVHGHEARVLKEARVHAAPGTRETVRHAVDDVVLEPLEAALGGEVVHRRGGFARVDRAAHHGHGQGRLLAATGHEGDGREHRHRGLAHAHHVAVAVAGLQQADEFLHVVHVVVEVELAFRQGHEAGVLPVGDEDLVALQHGAHGVAQQRGVVAGQRGHDQHRGLALDGLERAGVVAEALEAAQLAEGLVQLHPFVDDHLVAVHLDGGDAEHRLLVVLAQPVQQVVAGGHALGIGRVAERRDRIAVDLGDGLCEFRERLHQGTLSFVEVVEHGGGSAKNVAVQYSSSSRRACGVKLRIRSRQCDSWAPRSIKDWLL